MLTEADNDGPSRPCESTDTRMEGREEESVGSSKDGEPPTGSSNASSSELDESTAPASVKSEAESVSEDKDTLQDLEASTSDNPPLQSSTLPPSSSRLMRNLAEKMRRDKLNMYISELSSLVPIVAMATKRMDKTSVLRLSANFLRIHLSLKQSKKEKPVCAPEGLEGNLSTTLLDAIEGFMLIVTASGKIVYISDSVEKLLGHSQLDLMGQSLYTICHNGDHELLRHHLQPSSPFDTKERDSSDGVDYVPRSPSFFGGRPEDTLTGLASGERRSFYVRVAERSMARGDPARHVTVHLIGYLRPPNKKEAAEKNAKGKKECSSTTPNGDESLLVCVARPFRNKGITELSLMEAVQDEYVTRHLPDGRIIYSDHRIAFVAGYLTEEVMGLSAFNFIHQDDLPWATVANKQMFSSVEGQGYSVYRLRSKTGALIYLRTRGFLEFNKTTQKVETFVCINTLLTSDEGDKELEKERERITPFITFQQVTTTTSTNLTSVAGNTAQSLTQSSSVNALPQNLQSAVPITTKIITSVTMKHLRKEKSSLLLGTSATPSIASSATGCEVVEILSEQSGSSESMLSPAELVSVSTVPIESNVNGESIKNVNQNSLTVEGVSPISPPPSTSSTLSISDLTESFMDHNGQSVIQISPTSTIMTSTSRLPESHAAVTPGVLLPRLKRSFTEVEDLVVTTSAKRPIVPSAFITSYTPMHHSPHLGTKWGAETTTTIIFDQHNNNG